MKHILFSFILTFLYGCPFVDRDNTETTTETKGQDPSDPNSNGQEPNNDSTNADNPNDGSPNNDTDEGTDSSTDYLCQSTTVKYSSTIITEGNLNDSVSVVCDSGYTGGGTYTCQQSGSWIGEECILHYSNENGNIIDGTESGEYMLEAYAQEDINCGGTLVDFPDHSLVMEFTINNTEFSGRTISLPTTISSETDFYVDWGDSNCHHITSTSLESDLDHEYAEDGEVIVKIIGKVYEWGSRTKKNTYSKPLKKVNNLGDLSLTNLANSFYFTKNLTEINFPHTYSSNVLSMAYMFEETGLTSLDLTSLDTSSVEDMEGMFYMVGGLDQVNFENFDTSSVTKMDYMFAESTFQNLDLSSFDTSSVTNMEWMFALLANLKNINISSFDVSSVTSMKFLFLETDNIENVSFGDWNIKNDVMTNSMLTTSNLKNQQYNDGPNHTNQNVYCANLTSLIEDHDDFPNYRTSQDHDSGDIMCDETPPMIITFETISSDEQVTLGISGGTPSIDWGDGTVNTSLSHTYETPGEYEVWISGISTVTEVNNNWSNNLIKVGSLGDLTSVTSFISPFKDKTNLRILSGYVKLGAGITNLSSMFENASSLRVVDLSQMDSSNITNAENLFSGVDSLKILNLGLFETTSLPPSTDFLSNYGSSFTNAHGEEITLRCENNDDIDLAGNELVLNSTPYACED